MFVSRLIKPESDLYGRLSNWSKSLDKFMDWQPLHWFGMWCITISGFNIIIGQENRYIFWDWNSGSIFIFSSIILVTVWSVLSVRHPATPKQINNLRSLLYFIVIGSMALLLGSIGPKFSIEVIKNYVQYLLFYIAVWLVFSIEFIEQDDKSIEIVDSSPRIRNLVGATALIIVGTVMWFQFDDPVASTVSIVDPDEMIEIDRVETGIMPHGSRLLNNGLKHYSVAMMSGILYEIDAMTMEITRTIATAPPKMNVSSLNRGA